MTWLVTAFYTPDPLYRGCADALRSSLDALGVKHDLVAIAPVDTWATGCRYKPEFIRQQLHRVDANLVYLDVDAEVLRYPEEFNRLEARGVELAARYRPPEILASALWIRNTSYMRDLVTQWAREVAEMGEVEKFRLQEQQTLQRIIERRVLKGTLRFEPLPAEYCVLYGLPGEPEHPVILQKQASRKALGDTHVPVHPSLGGAKA